MAPVLIVQALLPGIVALSFSLLDRTAAWRGVPEWARQLCYGVGFGLVAVFATETGVRVVDGGVVNVRDAAPIVASLAFGCPAGIIAGLIGGVERWFCVLWGGGATTRLACSVSTVIAGLGSAALRKLVFDDRPPAMGYAIAIGITAETLHMLLVLLTNIEDLDVAFEYVQGCSDQMIILVGLATGIALIGRGYVNHERMFTRPPYLINDLGIRLFLTVLVTFGAVTWFTVDITGRVSESQAAKTLELSIEDVTTEIRLWGWEDLVGVNPLWRIQQTGAVIVYDRYNGVVLSKRGRDLNVRSDEVIADAPDKFEDDELYELTIFGKKCYAMYHSYQTCSIVAYLPVAEADYFSDVITYLTVFMEILVHASLFIILFQLMRKRVVEKLNYVGGSLDAIAAGQLDTVVDVRTHQEFCTLSDDINAMVASLREFISEAEHRRDSELELAQHIQHSSLPNVFPPFPGRKDIDLYATMNTAREVGGDFYDFFLLNSHLLVFLIADVSGKGVPAALFMMKAKSEIHSLMESGLGVDEAFAEANRRLCEANDLDMFVTAWLGKLDLETGTLSYANAGHNPPLVKYPNGTWRYLRDERPNLVLAGIEGTCYQKKVLMLEPGCRMYLYTDGVTEACDVDDSMYGEGRLEMQLNTQDGDDPRALCESVLDSVREFSRGAEQSDDVTMLAVDLRALRGTERIVTRANLGSTALISDFLDTRLHSLGVMPRVINRVQVAADEIYSNICRYGGADRAVVSAVREGGELLVEFCDNGVEFDPTAHGEPDTTLSADERPIGGLGIHMVRRMTTSMRYHRVHDTNILILAFSLK